MLTRLVQHVSLSPNFDVCQSAYKRRHSTETALLKLTDDIFARFADHRSTILVALDQSTAFDCIDHTTLTQSLVWSNGNNSKLDKFISWVLVNVRPLEARVVVVCSTTRNRCSTGVGPWAATFLFVYCTPLQSYPCSRNKLPTTRKFTLLFQNLTFRLNWLNLKLVRPVFMFGFKWVGCN